MALYGKVEYWDQRYLKTAQSSPCEWYRGYGHLRHLLNPIFFATSSTAANIKSSGNLSASVKPPASSTSSSPKPPSPKMESFKFPDRDKARILILGCGNSTFGADMLRDGWSSGGGEIINVDFSKVVIEQMKAKYGRHFYEHHKTNNEMQWICADFTQKLPFDDGYFDLIVCKGALDAVLCSEGNKASMLLAVAECKRLLVPGHGIFFLVSNGNPDNRFEYLELGRSLDFSWRGVSVHLAPKLTNDASEKPVYTYICRKRASEPNISPGNKENVAASTASWTTNSTTTAKLPPGFETKLSNASKR